MTSLFEEHNKSKASFPVRLPTFKYEMKDRYWYNGEPAITHFFNSLQSIFPDLELLMINAVRATKPQIRDPKLLKDISAFIGQEAQHAAKHREFNQHYHELSGEEGLPELEKLYARVHEWTERNLSDRQRLALTLAFEHFTAMVAPVIMQRADILEAMGRKAPDAVTLAMWHAVEECEHKAVAYDAYMATGGGYTARTVAVLVTTIVGLTMVFGGGIYLMKKDGQMTNWRAWKGALKFGFGRKGLAYDIFKKYPQWFVPGFHPNDHDTSELEAYWKNRLGIPTTNHSAV